MPLFQILSALAGMGLSAYGESQRQSAEEKYIEERKKERLKYIADAKYTFGEKEAVLSSINKNYNTQGLNTLNNSAFGMNNFLNSDTVKSFMSSKLLGERANAMSNAELKIEDYNKKLDSEMLKLPYDMPNTFNTGNVIGGGLAGFEIGNSLEKLFKK